MSAALGRVRELFSLGVAPRLVLAFAIALLLFSTLHQFASGFVCIGYACPSSFALPGEPHFYWPSLDAILGGLSARAIILALVITPLSLIGALLSIRSVWLWLTPCIALAILVAMFAVAPQIERSPHQALRIYLAFTAGIITFLAPLLAFHAIGWRKAQFRRGDRETARTPRECNGC